MADTTIEWTDATWNPVAGCSIMSAGCTNCYAMRMAERLAQTKPMVFATMMEGDPESGDFGEPKLIFFHGAEKPEEVSNMQSI